MRCTKKGIPNLHKIFYDLPCHKSEPMPREKFFRTWTLYFNRQYYAILYSHLSYGSMVWSLTTQSNLEIINKLQKKYIRIINFLGFRDYKNRYFCSNKIIKFYDIIQTNQVLFGYQFISKTLPKDILDLFIQNSNIHDHNTRLKSNHALHIPM